MPAVLVTAGAVYLRERTTPPVPAGLPGVPWPENNRYSPDKAELGRVLFFDKRLSTDGSIACASCHEPGRAFADSKALAVGIRMRKGTRNAMAVINAAYTPQLFWDGRASSLEELALGPLANRDEMTDERDSKAAHAACLARLRSIRGYRALFRRAFGSDAIEMDRVAAALATFMRTLASDNSPYDRFTAGDPAAMTLAQRRGKDVFFGKGNCSACHPAPLFTDHTFANDGIGADRRRPDRGYEAVAGTITYRGAFRVPTLREVARTAPYMHDGSLKTLQDVVEHYDRGGVAHSGAPRSQWIDERIQPLNLTEVEKADLVAFLKALNGEGWQHARPPAEFPR